mmetsp:Transcript_45970/g.116330  ORF Transcript_45970/g.116330 Transcript_45970/m.116330 type:complete len:265 (-) Transcript_45970:463-1257(-)
MARDSTVECVMDSIATDVRAVHVAHHVEVQRVAAKLERLPTAEALNVRDVAWRGTFLLWREQHCVSSPFGDLRGGVALNLHVARQNAHLSPHVNVSVIVCDNVAVVDILQRWLKRESVAIATHTSDGDLLRLCGYIPTAGNDDFIAHCPVDWLVECDASITDSCVSPKLRPCRQLGQTMQVQSTPTNRNVLRAVNGQVGCNHHRQLWAARRPAVEGDDGRHGERLLQCADLKMGTLATQEDVRCIEGEILRGIELQSAFNEYQV